MLSFFESLLPGTRSLRPVLFAGLLWTGIVWALLHPEVPSPSTATGMADQAFRAAEFLGPVVTSIILGVGVFILGALAAPVHAIAAQLVGRLLDAISVRTAWQTHAQRQRVELAAQLESEKAKLESFETRLGELDEGPKKTSLKNSITQTAGRIATTQTALDVLPTKGLLKGRYIRNTSETRRAIGDPPVVSERSDEYLLIKAARDRGAEEALEHFKVDVPLREALQFASDRPLHELTTQLQQEMEPDPLDLLQALGEEDLYLEQDRERAEREVRLAIAIPLVAVGILITVETSRWGLVVTVAALLLFTRSALEASRATRRVISMIRRRGLEPPAVKEAMALGRDEVRQHMQHIASQEQQEKKVAETRAAAQQVTQAIAKGAVPSPSPEE